MSHPSHPVAYRARYLFPASGPPVPEGVVRIADGGIIAVEDRHAPGPAVDLGPVAILPGLINVHTHLEFSDLDSPLGSDGMAFPDWLNAIVHRRRQRAQDPVAAVECRRQAIERGLAESLRHGVSMLGEIATPDFPTDVYDHTSVGVTVFLELLGLSADRVEPLWQAACEHGPPPAARWLAGLSPHAPYTVRPELVQRVCRLSAEKRLPVAMHLAESFEETELLRSASGPLVQWLQSLDAWDATAVPRGIQSLDYLRWLATAQRALVIHGNYLSGEELAFLGAHAESLALVYCPRTHARFRHAAYPLAEALAAGVNVALGTDSRASSPDLSLLEDMRAAYFLHPEVPAAQILRLGTAAGAAALGRSHITGDLRPGLRADLAIVPLPERTAADPYELLFEADTDVCRVCCGGTWCEPLSAA